MIVVDNIVRYTMIDDETKKDGNRRSVSEIAMDRAWGRRTMRGQWETSVGGAVLYSIRGGWNREGLCWSELTKRPGTQQTIQD
eukprot:9618711-Heterocapsa_arctica.AAC.1